MWYSLHGYIHNYQELNNYMKDDFNRFLKENSDEFQQYFFIRYWLGGPHVRFRFKLKRPSAFNKIKTSFEKSIQEFLADKSVELADASDFYTEAMLKNESVKEVYWMNHGTVEAMDYEPEVERYRGENGMEDTETLFFESSKLAESVNTLSYEKKVIVSLNMFYWVMKVFEQPAIFLSHYRCLWQGYAKDRQMQGSALLSKAAKVIIEKDRQPVLFKEYLQQLREKISLNQEEDYGVLFSHIHMFNNRIGIHPEYEYHLSSLLYRELEEEL